MFPSFLPPEVQQLTEAPSIALAQNMERQPIATPLTPQPIATTYVCEGTGDPPILLLHGFDSSVLEFRRLLPLLAQERQTWAVDLLGFGFTERIPGVSLNVVSIETHLYRFWETLIRKPVILVGASMGGATAIDLALAHPEVVEKLVLIDSAGLSNPPLAGTFMFPPLDSLATAFLRHPQVRQSISRSAYYNKDLASRDAQLCAALHLKCSGWSRALIAFTKSGGYGSLENKLPNLGKRTLILWGENDRILGTGDARKFQQLIPKSHLVWIQNCGHVPHLEKPEIAAGEILASI